MPKLVQGQYVPSKSPSKLSNCQKTDSIAVGGPKIPHSPEKMEGYNEKSPGFWPRLVYLKCDPTNDDGAGVLPAYAGILTG